MRIANSLGVLVVLAGFSMTACSSGDTEGSAAASTGGTAVASGGTESGGASTGGTIGTGGLGAGGTTSGGSESGGTANGGRESGGTQSGGAAVASGGTQSGGSSAAGSAGMAGEPEELPSDGKSFDIGFDYTYDTAGFYDERKRKILVAAAATWSRYIADDFPNIPAGTMVRTRHPEHTDMEGMNFMLDYEIDDLVLVVGSQSLDGAGMRLASTSSSFTGQVSDKDLLTQLQARYDLNPFEPWIAQATFDPDEDWNFDETPETHDDLPSDRQDFMSTAIHEIGHALGIGSAKAFEALVVDSAFVGEKAMEVYGGPVPLEPGGDHFAHDIMSNEKTPSLELGTQLGERKLPTALDLAVLEDLGYTIRWDLVDD